MDHWIITNGPWKSRGSSNVHGVPTGGPTRVIRAEDAATTLDEFHTLLGAQVDPDIIRRSLKVIADAYRGKHDRA